MWTCRRGCAWCICWMDSQQSEPRLASHRCPMLPYAALPLPRHKMRASYRFWPKGLSMHPPGIHACMHSPRYLQPIHMRAPPPSTSCQVRRQSTLAPLPTLYAAKQSPYSSSSSRLPPFRSSSTCSYWTCRRLISSRACLTPCSGPPGVGGHVGVGCEQGGSAEGEHQAVCI